MKMNMKHGLVGFLSIVDYQAEAVIENTQVPGHFIGNMNQFAQQ